LGSMHMLAPRKSVRAGEYQGANHILTEEGR
jgi:hypothetical protein